MGQADPEINFKKCIKSGNLKFDEGAGDLIDSEIRTAQIEQEECEFSVNNNKWRSAVRAGYYSIFHLARALLFKKGYRERNHVCLGIGLEYLYPGQEEMVRIFRLVQGIREESDYECNYQREDAVLTLNKSKEFYELYKKIK